jgi:ABC-type lipoprotein export system ATPase subunit
MKYESAQIIEQFAPVIKTALQKSFEGWQNYHKGRISELESIINSLKILLVHSDEWAKKPDSFWNELETEFSKIRLWTESLRYVSPQDLENKISHPLIYEFDKLLEDYPDELRVLIGDTYWRIQDNDSLFRKIRKKYQPLKGSIASNINKLINKYRDLRHKPPIQIKPVERVIKLNSILNFYLKNPIIQFMIDEWQRYLQAVTGQLFILHLNAKEFANKSLILEELPAIIDPKKENDIFNKLFELAEVLKVAEENLQALLKYENTFNDRFEKYWKELSESFLWAWEWAGTFQLKNKMYSGNRLNHLEYSIGSKFKKYRSAWEDHFRTFQGEWQKDTEISLLRYKTVKNLYRTSSTLHEGFQAEIDPCFLRVRDLLTETSSQVDQTKDESSLRSLVTNNRKSILIALQNLLETIHSVGIVRLLEDSLKTLTTSTNNLGEKHLGFVKQDTERRPPRSIIESVPLKDLVKDEIFEPFQQTYAETISNTEVKTKLILRIISEIDQLIEFNSDSTLKLLNQSNSWPVFERAKSEMSEGLERAGKRLTGLRKDLAQIPDQCSEDLLTIGLEFETELEKFLDSEKLFKFKGQLKRKRFFNNIKHMSAASFKILISFFPALYKGMRRFLKKIWRKYFSLKPAVHDHRQSDIEKISRYLSETEARISKLPFLYQKLFHFQSLNDKRFFTNRYSEIKILKSEYKKWEKGTPTAIAIIGERGSGLTTFLNFIENEIYSEVPTTRVVFSKPEYNQDIILKTICDAFHFKHLDNWEELEQKIHEDDSFKICILENLHYMYLKTVSGFNGLEKFLNMLSRTKNSVFWISTCTLYSWQFLKKAISVDSHFQRLLTLYKITPEELKSIIMKRHRASGYLLEFDAAGNPRRLKRAKFGEDNSHHSNLERNYFEKLHDFAGGNIATAIMVWLRSIKEFSKDKMVLTANFDIDFRFLNRLSEENVLTLSAIIYHEVMSPESHSAIFNQNMDRSRLQLENLESEGILIKNGSGYLIHPFIYRPLVQILKKKNILS